MWNMTATYAVTADCFLLCLCIGAVFNVCGCVYPCVGTQGGGQHSMSAGLFLKCSSPDFRKYFLLRITCLHLIYLTMLTSPSTVECHWVPSPLA